MRDRVTVVTHSPNTLLPLPEVRKVFHHDGDAFLYSEAARDYIELRMMAGESFQVRTSDTVELEEKRVEVVFGSSKIL